MTEKPQLRIVCAAMKMEDGMIVSGVRHYSPDMRVTMKRIYGEGYHLKVIEQGFIDQFGQFHEREPAYFIAKACKQILREVSTPGTLFSENLY